MATCFTTGPVDIWVGQPGIISNGYSTFLGHSERGPTVQVKPHYQNLYVDLGGQNVPFDMLYDGEDAMVTCDLTRWNESVLEQMQIYSKTFLSPAGAVPGVDPPLSIGTLMITEGASYQLWLHFPKSGAAGNVPTPGQAAYATMPAGLHFYNAFLVSDDYAGLGAKPRKQHLVWHCLRSFTPVASTGTFTLFDYNMSGISGVIN